jgi:hypothetical protein
MVASMHAPALPPMTGSEIYAASLAGLWKGHGSCHALEDCFVVSGSTTGAPTLDMTFGYPVQFRNVSLAAPGVIASDWTIRDGVVRFTATSTAVTPYLSFYTGVLGYFEPNSLTVLPGMVLNVTFRAFGGATTISDVKSSLRANCLNNVGSCLA